MITITTEFRNYGIIRELTNNSSLSHLPSGLSLSGFSKSLNGFLMMLTQKGKLIYISDNAAEYLGHSMVSNSFAHSIYTCILLIPHFLFQSHNHLNPWYKSWLGLFLIDGYICFITYDCTRDLLLDGISMSLLHEHEANVHIHCGGRVNSNVHVSWFRCLI